MTVLTVAGKGVAITGTALDPEPQAKSVKMYVVKLAAQADRLRKLEIIIVFSE